MKKLAFLLSMSAVLVGCKTDIIAPITTDDLESSEHKIVSGNVLVEVLTCNDYDDSRIESRSLVEAKSKVGSILKESEYIECYDKQMKSYASFKIPIGVGAVGDDGNLSFDSDVFVFSSKDIYLGAVLNPNLLQRMEQDKKRSFFSDKIDLNMSISLKVGNKPIPNVSWQSVYLSSKALNVGKIPIISETLTGDGIEDLIITISDVASESLMSGSPIVIGKRP